MVAGAAFAERTPVTFYAPEYTLKRQAVRGDIEGCELPVTSGGG